MESSLGARHRSEQQVRQFVADASHELRTPLTTIKGYAELARRRPEDSLAVLAALDKVESESGRMTSLVEDLLLLARLDSGRPLEREPVDLTHLLLEAVSDARVVAPDHHWRLDLPETALQVVGDEQRLHQVATNLLTNARKHTPAGTTVTVTARRRRPDRARRRSGLPGRPGADGVRAFRPRRHRTHPHPRQRRRPRPGPGRRHRHGPRRLRGAHLGAGRHHGHGPPAAGPPHGANAALTTARGVDPSRLPPGTAPVEGDVASFAALRHGDIGPEPLRTAAQDVRGKGAARARRVAATASGSAANPFESVLRALALDAGLEVEPQGRIDLGDLAVHPDLVDRGRRLVLEADSWEFHTSRDALERDCERYTLLVLDDWTVLRFTWRQVMRRPDYVRRCLRAARSLPAPRP